MNRRIPAESRRSPATMKDEDAPIIPVRAMAAIQRKQPMPIGRNRLIPDLPDDACDRLFMARSRLWRL
jgi:hypothetical protein